MRRRILAVASALAIVVLAAPGAVAVTTPPVPVSGPTPFAPNCNGAPQPGTLYPNAEVEPWVNANPRAPANMIAVWQQDRWSNGGAQGNLTGVTFDAGRSWEVVESPPPFSRCAGGNAANGGDYERASDPGSRSGGTGPPTRWPSRSTSPPPTPICSTYATRCWSARPETAAGRGARSPR